MTAVLTSPAKQRTPVGSHLPARLRIVAWILLTVAIGLVAVVITIRNTSVAAVERRANEDVTQEIDQFMTFAEEYDLSTSGPVQLIAAHLQQQFPEDDQVMLGYVPYRAGAPLITHTAPDPVGLTAAPGHVGDMVQSGARSGTSELDGSPFRWGAVAIEDPSGQRAWFVVAVTTEEGLNQVDREVQVVAGVCIGGLLLTALVAWAVAGQILGPVRAVRRAAAEITQHDLDRRIDTSGRDDVAALATTFNAMLDRISSSFTAKRRFARVAAGHMYASLERLERQTPSSPDRDAEIARMRTVLRDLTTLADAGRPGYAERRPVDLGELTTRLAGRIEEETGTEWAVESRAEGTGTVDPDLLEEAVVRLARNALQATRNRTALRFGARTRDGELAIWVTDDGPGLDPEQAERIFNRFSDTGRSLDQPDDSEPDENRRTAVPGFGLAVVRAVADAHQGTAWVDTSEPGRCSVGLNVPLAGPEADTGALEGTGEVRV
ncbi:sensor histidine kinase [Georgenia alba]|uniref:histidine kinase n=1 Tax=Georgenia alba TaxID=2233858 RepID=A0ABW2Q2X3_9MICO